MEAASVEIRSAMSLAQDATLRVPVERLGPLGSHRDLLRQVLLHLPRFGAEALEDPTTIESEIRLRADRLRTLRMNAPTELQTAVAVESLADLSLRPVDEALALAIHAHFHYLGSARSGDLHLGLWPNHSTRPAVLVTLSRFDLRHLELSLPEGLLPDEILVLSRLYAFAGCPRNALSFTLGRVQAWLRSQRPRTKILLTYLDPNLGFSGTVYRASNWRQLCREHKRRYLYLDDSYVTDRQMIGCHGTADLRTLRGLLGARIQASKRPLLPLEIFVHDLRHHVELSAGDDVSPPAALVGSS